MCKEEKLEKLKKEYLENLYEVAEDLVVLYLEGLYASPLPLPFLY